ncbi:hemophore [Mycobacterium marseillense]|jgi:hemophore|uniref:Hemophore n=1 Tax=Mycobacterium marseillense TaxID=701042 RepID=A0AAC9YNC7_9MYCO|nr:hemophore [Mycobacterium marseillense]ASW92475.1 hemophore [Mycobacterium marseillense]MCA2264946.1 hemophore [Mycobacterium marseillense]MCV7406335.1 hemophore [Mycobacterium marseillense]MDM3975740.1 hemophore [Mycobacterium marseillense]OBJ74555.1 hemophore [Mycobacterium marseillense]
MTTGSAGRRRRIFAGLIAATAPGAALAVLAGPAATGANDPCAASEVARTIGSVSKSMGDYLDSHPETNQTMTSMLQQQAGPQSLSGLKSYFDANPKVAGDMTSIAQPLTNLSLQCKLPISIPQMMGMMQQAQGAAGALPALPGSPAGVSPLGGTGAPPAAPQPAPPAAANPLSGPPRGNTVG